MGLKNNDQKNIGKANFLEEKKVEFSFISNYHFFKFVFIMKRAQVILNCCYKLLFIILTSR